MAAPFELAPDVISELLLGGIVRDLVEIYPASEVREW
jgi:hypothetical protein